MPPTTPPGDGVSLGIDFGTSNTVVAIRYGDGRVQHQLFDGSPQLPSAVYLEDRGELVTGREAVRLGHRDPARYEPNPKRRIDDGAVLLGTEEVAVADLVAAVFARVAEECRRTLDGSPDSFAVTVPAGWGPTRRLVITDAAAAAGLGDAVLLPEPVAAAQHFLAKTDLPANAAILVYDLGGGTFDATVVRRTSAGFTVLSQDSADIGGVDIDQALCEHLAATCEPGDPRWQRILAPATEADRRHRVAFRTAVREVKETLARRSAVALTVPLLECDTHLTRDELDAVAGPLLQRTVTTARSVLRDSGLGAAQLDGVFLVGAASRMPLVATLLHRELGVAPTAVEQPELAVAEGALASFTAVHGAHAGAPGPGAPREASPGADGRATEPLAPPAQSPDADRARSGAAPGGAPAGAVLPAHAPGPRPGPDRPPLPVWAVLATVLVPAWFWGHWAFDGRESLYFLLVTLVALPAVGGLALVLQRFSVIGVYFVLAAASFTYWATIVEEGPKFLLAVPFALAAAGLLGLRRPAVAWICAVLETLFVIAVVVQVVPIAETGFNNDDRPVFVTLIMAAALLVWALAMYLLFTPRSRRWFGRAAPGLEPAPSRALLRRGRSNRMWTSGAP
ncbi:Hsp70 family protein [Glycomyces sp. A-F 0318]|uniref:Hsp70 family protein n=1 Tax=Glycomyces amatae TaxID=2881355 RepID=UPI001E40B0FC|nr:Hsp70 family protein [Glycomyces amatae]MCD0442823.1 Hsp70 family protein [Glycomyces amatae]